MSKTKFSHEWLDSQEFSDWVKPSEDKFKAECSLCKKSIDLTRMGISALRSHAKSLKHVQKVDSLKLSKVSSFFKVKEKEQNNEKESDNSSNKSCLSSPTSSSSNSGTLEKYICSKDVTVAEIRWCLKVVMSSMSFRTCIDICDLFKTIFHDSQIAKDMSISKTKCSYFISYGIAPYVKKNLLKNVQKACFYVISFDESMNSVLQEEQLDVILRFWDANDNMVKTRYFDSQFLRRPNAENLINKLNSSTEEISKNHLIQISMDGPSVNWKLWELLASEREEKDLPQLINIGSCGLHIFHGAFQQGAKKTLWNIEKVLKSIFNLFNESPARRDLYIQVTESNVFPLR